MESGAGLSIRLAWAVVSAVLGGVWLWRAMRRNSAAPPRTARFLSVTVLALCAFWALVWLAIALIRLPYPFELEWAGGAMRDMAVHAMKGQPLYVPPGGGWFPYEYPPLYAWLSSFLMRFTGVSFAPMRLISIASTIGCAWILFVWVRDLTKGRSDGKLIENRKSKIENPWPALAAGLFLAAYRFTGAWYDIERIDMLFLLLSLVGIYWLHRGIERKRMVWVSGSAVAFALAFLTKQQTVLFIVGGIGALVSMRRWGAATLFTGASVVLCTASAGAVDASTHGWFWYYCFRVPMANGIKLHLAREYFPPDFALYAPILAILLLGILALRRPEAKPGPPLMLLGWMTAMAIAGSLLSRAHWGGDQNVLIPEYTFLGAAACVLAARLNASLGAGRAPLCALVLAQLITLTYRPQAQIPTEANRMAGERYASTIRDLERGGEVLCLDHGGFTTVPHSQILGLMDVMNTQKGLPRGLLDALRSHRYAAIVTDAQPTASGALGEILRDYPHIERVGITNTWVVTGFLSPNPERSVWILRP